LKVSKIGNISIVLHRIPKGKLKTMTIKVNQAEQWFVIFACEITIQKIKHLSTEKVGIDVGLEHFVMLSDGETIKNPRYFIKTERQIKRLQRNLSRKKKGSTNWRKARIKVAKQYIKIANRRRDFLHKLAYGITKRYAFIAVEDLNINGMMNNHHLAKHISDASWNSFIQMLSYKAVASGGQLVKVNPSGTSKTCSNCRTIVDMPLHKRQFNCPNCGFVCHRDLNSAINIIKLGLGESEVTPVDDCVRPSPMKAMVCESGTIRNKS